MTRPEPRRLSDHVTEAMAAMLERVVARNPERRDELAAWAETAHHQVEVQAEVALGRGGKPDTRSLMLRVFLRTSAGRAPLCAVRARDLITEDGTPVDARADARAILLQLGYGIPDDVSSLTGPGQTDAPPGT